jgi:hypothetical protein
MTSRGRRKRALADIEVGAAARARRLRFRRKPEARVEFEGGPGLESDSHTERENLPQEIEPGIVYRDVRVGWIAGARIDDEEVEELERKIAARGRQGARESKES